MKNPYAALIAFMTPKGLNHKDLMVWAETHAEAKRFAMGYITAAGVDPGDVIHIEVSEA